jgi:hypothetical protein
MTTLLKGHEAVAGATVNDFWSWAFSDLNSNTLRGLFAEWLVASACGVTNRARTEWDAVDLTLEDKTKVEVKSSAYIQSWEQTTLSKPSFTIRRTRAWTAKDGFENESKRQAQVYVFCLLAEKSKEALDVLNTDQWEFYVLPTRVFERKVPKQKTIGLNSLLKLGPEKVEYSEIGDAVRRASLAE